MTHNTNDNETMERRIKGMVDTVVKWNSLRGHTREEVLSAVGVRAVADLKNDPALDPCRAYRDVQDDARGIMAPLAVPEDVADVVRRRAADKVRPDPRLVALRDAIVQLQDPHRTVALLLAGGCTVWDIAETLSVTHWKAQVLAQETIDALKAALL